MNPIQCTARVVTNVPLGDDFFSMTASCPEIAADCRPGQFAMVDTGANHVPYVKRPLAIAASDARTGTLRFIYRAVGTGTRLLSHMESRRAFTIVGPLGNGYAAPPAKSTVLLVAGGVGLSSLLSLLPLLQGLGCESHFVLGARNQGGLICLDELQALGAQVSVSTEDGSAGYHGFPTPVVQKLLAGQAFGMAYICGPEPMMRAVAGPVVAAGVPCQVSLERRMGCGIGVCVGCSCKLNDPERGLVQKRVCKDGPVFNAKEVVWNG